MTRCLARLRGELRAPLPRERIAAALATTCELWRDRGFEARGDTLSRAARASGFSSTLLDESLDALLAPFHPEAFERLAARLVTRPQLLGFIMPGNVIGAGLHEVCQAMVGGAAIILKTASAEPLFFAAFVRTLRAIDAQVGARIEVLSWSRADIASTAALKASCDLIVAFGDDQSIAALGAAHVIAFGSRASGALITADCDAIATADAIARDVSLFEQRGCLSPHHVFVENSDRKFALEFAAELAAALDRFARRFAAPPRLPLPEAAAIRSARENARWRRIGKHLVTMWEGEHLGWTVIYDAGAKFQRSPGYRTVYVSPFIDRPDLGCRLNPAGGQLEAFAITPGTPARTRALLEEFGLSYFAAPGAMQSPPLEWRHGGGALLDLFLPR